MLPVPNNSNPIVDKTGRNNPAWTQFLQQFVQVPPPVIALTVGVSPFSYEAKEPGTVAITGGTISSIVLTRGTVNITVTGTILIPLELMDAVTVTYSVLPTMRFLRRYGPST